MRPLTTMESYGALAAALLEAVAHARQIQTDWLKTQGLDWATARALRKPDQAKLSAEWAKHYAAEGPRRISLGSVRPARAKVT